VEHGDNEKRRPAKNDDRPRDYRKDTLLTHLGRHPEAHHGAVNPPVYHASTILSATMAEWEEKCAPGWRFDVVRYGLLGTPTTFALEEAVAAIEGRLSRDADILGPRRGDCSGSRATKKTRSRWRAGCRRAAKLHACSTRPWRKTPATRYGNAIFSAAAVSWAWC
jgi:hypothetical protein